MPRVDKPGPVCRDVLDLYAGAQCAMADSNGYEKRERQVEQRTTRRKRGVCSCASGVEVGGMAEVADRSLRRWGGVAPKGAEWSDRFGLRHDLSAKFSSRH